MVMCSTRLIILACLLCGCPQADDGREPAITRDSGDNPSAVGRTAKESQFTSPAPAARAIDELFNKFTASPDRESYLAVREALISSEFYDPNSTELGEVEEFLDSGPYVFELAGARDRIDAAMPNLILSPSAHLLKAFIAKESGDEKVVQIEKNIAGVCLLGLLSTGDGSKANPYLVVRTSDEHDVLGYLGKEFSKQSLIHDGDRRLDRIRCQDGTEVWFDVTDVFNGLKNRTSERPL
jgi:hypothetical protein